MCEKTWKNNCSVEQLRSTCHHGGFLRCAWPFDKAVIYRKAISTLPRKRRNPREKMLYCVFFVTLSWKTGRRRVRLTTTTLIRSETLSSPVLSEFSMRLRAEVLCHLYLPLLYMLCPFHRYFYRIVFPYPNKFTGDWSRSNLWSVRLMIYINDYRCW